MQEADHLRHCERLNRQPIPGDTEHVFTFRRKPVKDCNRVASKRAVEAGIAAFRWHDLCVSAAQLRPGLRIPRAARERPRPRAQCG